MRVQVQNYVYLALGWVFFLIGFVGIFLPLLPTTPFMILAAGCFSKGSPKLHAWLLDHPRVGPPLKKWQDHRVITPRAKTLATALILASATFTTLQSNLSNIAIVGLWFCCLGAIVFIQTRRSKVPHRDDPQP